MKRGLKYLSLLGLLLLIGLVSAGSNLGVAPSSYSNIYGLNSTFSGWVNISFNSESLGSVLSDNLGNSILLKNLLDSKINSNYNYKCDRIGCVTKYDPISPSDSMSFSLKKGQSKIIGFVFNGFLSSFDSADFKVQTDAPISCENQLGIDVFNDGTVNIENLKQSTQTCGTENYSCFDSGEKQNEILLGSVPFCQKFMLEKAPGYNLGAWVKETTAGTKKIVMSLYDSSGILLKKCELDKTKIKGVGSEVSCEVNSTIKEANEYYVCVNAENGTGEYKTRGYIPKKNACGFFGQPIKTETNAYQIFVQKSKYDLIGNFKMGTKLGSKEKFGMEIQDYINRKYGGLDCSDGCLVPIKFISNENQNITISNLDIIYNKLGLPGTEEKTFYQFRPNMSKINSSFQKLYLGSADFKLPSTLGSLSYNILLNNKTIFENTIKIENISISLYPMIIPVMFKTKINLISKLPFKVVSYHWNFGDGDEATTSENSVFHSYNVEGPYNLIVKLTDGNGNILSKTFNIEVKTSKSVIEKAITNLNNKIVDLKNQTQKLNNFERQSFLDYLNLNSTESLLDSIKANLTLSSAETNYSQYVKTILNINLPKGYLLIPTGEIAFVPKEDSIDLGLLAKIQNETSPAAGDEENYKKAILFWFQKNVDVRIKSDAISYVMDGGGVLPGFKTFTITFSSKNGSIGNDYLVMKNLDGLKFDKNYGQRLINGYQTFKIGNNGVLRFSTTEDVDFQNLSFYIAPKLSAVLVSPKVIPENKKKHPGPLFFYIFLAILIGIGVGAYFLINHWYIKKYEKHLFPKINNLYNVINYIHLAKQKNLGDSEIKLNLKKVGWNSEQINYALKKYGGKQVGMPGLSKSISKEIPKPDNSKQTLINKKR